MFDRFTDRAKKVMYLSRQQALRLHHDHIGTEHILLGLIQEGSGVAANVLKSLGVDFERLRLEVGAYVKAGRQVVTMSQLPFTPRAKVVLELAMEEASRLSHNYIGSEHLLLGLIKEQKGIAARALTSHGVDLAATRAEVIAFLDSATDTPARRLDVVEHEGAFRDEPGDEVARFELRLLAKLVAPFGLAIRVGLAYVIVPSDVRGEQLFRDALLPALGKLGLEVVRAPDLGAPGADLAPAWRHLCVAEFVLIAPGKSADASYLLGLSHGIGRCPILLIESEAELLPCMRSLPWVTYGPGTEGLARLAVDLERHLRSMRTVRSSGGLT
jgi:hypothetical protein